MPDNHQEHVHLPIGIVKKSTGAHAKAVVRVVEIQGNLARFEILELEPEPEPEWPEGVDPLEAGKPLYLALADSFEPDPEQQGTEEESEPFSEVIGDPLSH